MRRKGVRRSWPAALVAVALLAGCQTIPPATGGDQTPPPRPAVPIASPASADAPRRAAAPVRRVVAISVDGLNPRAIRKLGRTRAPNFHRMLREGASTLNARTAREQTRTLPNHTGMFTGRRIDEDRGGHGVDFNTDTGVTVHRAAGHYVASIFDVVHDYGGSTALYSAKEQFALYRRSWNAAGASDRVGRSDGRAKIDRFVVDTDNARLVARLTTELRTSPRTLTVLHLSLPDVIGHEHGFMGKRYLTAVRTTDRLLGQILTTIVARPTLRRSTLVLLTSDHGGRGATHESPAKLQNYRVPFVAWGPEVDAGRNLYALNAGYRSPGSRRTTYRGRQPVRNADLANLVTDVLGLPRVPGSEFNRRQTLRIFR